MGRRASRRARCLLSCKDTNLKAIHNQSMLQQLQIEDVFYLAKILIWKQFTTYARDTWCSYGCLLSCKDTNLKAIHNYGAAIFDGQEDVFYLAKILIWKQFTTAPCMYALNCRCLLSCKDTNLKAIHIAGFAFATLPPDVFYLAKILIWKQFTTYKSKDLCNTLMSSILQRY